MKLLFALLTSLALVGTAQAEAVVKEVCTPKVDKAGKAVMDKKTGKQAEDCKKIKTHKKVEGDKVPDASKKK
jgi:predicted pyridoxine 5'-phosphate oxidase superfamily flavin-nucleotide-binding protein